MTEPIFQKPIIKRQVIYGTVPSKSNCYKIITFKHKSGKSHASLAATKQLKQYEKDFYIQCNFYRNANIQGYFQFDADIYYPNQRSDLDNSAKVLLDCLQKIGAFPNDNKLVCLRMNKFLDKLNPRVEFTINPVMEQLEIA